MITVHHLNESRSHRILWLLEEIGKPYKVAPYQRDAATRLAPPELKAVHPLGKSPVLVDGKRTLFESAAIIEYLIRRYARGRLAPREGSNDWIEYIQWLHYAEGSAILPLILALYVSRLGEGGAPLHPRIDSEIANHLGFIDQRLKGREFIAGRRFSGADVQIGYVLDAADSRGRLEPFADAKRYLEALRARPAYIRATARGG